MKKLVLVLLVTLLAFTIAACRGEEEAEYPAAPPVESSEDVNGSLDVEDTDAEDEESDPPEVVDGDREDSDEEAQDRDRDDEDREDIGSGNHPDLNLLTDEEIEAMFGGGGDIWHDWDDAMFDFVDGLEEELWNLIDGLENELDRLIDGTEDEYRMDNLCDQFCDFLESIDAQWDDWNERFEEGLIGTPEFLRGLEGVVQQVRDFTFR